MQGDVYHKVVNVPSKATITAIIVIGIALIYVVLAMAGAIPQQYNLLSAFTKKPTQTAPVSNSNNTTAVSSYPTVEVWGIPQNINLTQNPHTSWQITFRVTKGEVDNLKIWFEPSGLTNVSVSLSGASNWNITGTIATYDGSLTEGSFVTITLNVDALTNYTVSNNAKIIFQPLIQGVVFESSTFTTTVSQ